MDKRRVGVRAIIYKDGKILVVRHKSRKDGKPKDFWAIPGGGLDSNESLEDGLRREIEEELGVTIKVGRLLFIQQFLSTREDRDEELEFFFVAENSDDFVAVDIKKTSHGANELAECRFIEPVGERILPEFISEVNLEAYVEGGLPVLITNELNVAEIVSS